MALIKILRKKLLKARDPGEVQIILSNLGGSEFNGHKLLKLAYDPLWFGFFTTKPYIPSVYFGVGGTPAKDFENAKNGGPAVPSHHSPLFKITPEPAVTSGVEATVLALLELMPKK